MPEASEKRNINIVTINDYFFTSTQNYFKLSMLWIYFISLLLLLLFVYIPQAADIFILLFSLWLSSNILIACWSRQIPETRNSFSGQLWTGSQGAWATDTASCPRKAAKNQPV